VFCEAATAAILEAMNRHGVLRIIALTGAMIGDMDQGQSLLMQNLAVWIAAKQPAAAADRAGQEKLLMDSDREWTIVKPPRLTDGPLRSRTKSGTHMRIGLLSRISRPDLAEFMLDQIDSTEYVRQRVLVKA
jgi:putative NADH-flavin reductase